MISHESKYYANIRSQLNVSPAVSSLDFNKSHWRCRVRKKKHSKKTRKIHLSHDINRKNEENKNVRRKVNIFSQINSDGTVINDEKSFGCNRNSAAFSSVNTYNALSCWFRWNTISAFRRVNWSLSYKIRSSYRLHCPLITESMWNVHTVYVFKRRAIPWYERNVHSKLKLENSVESCYWANKAENSSRAMDEVGEKQCTE